MALRDEEDQIHWDRVFTLNDRARTGQETKRVEGPLLGVTGCIRERSQASRSGEKKGVQEIYGVVIKLR